MATEQQINDFLGDCNCATEPTKYLVNYSLVGCLPDGDPGIFDSFADAKESLIWILGEFIDDNDGYNEDRAEIFTHLREDANLMSSPGDLVGGGYHFWITEDSDPELSRDEFSASQCDCCDTTLAGERYNLVGYNPKTHSIDDLGSVCTDCRHEFEYGAGSSDDE